ncbi:nuclear envelope integral membrane protein [Toxorhynchites rutilus septentrionalis]|uniref:nuclear envelope integral membrane protein n=1 Tax=Toxorhynchites rutilus septentrionalis TaxID=329112 RepID=UPI00247B196F|nr:nuclear envelope integral membrane protein [Toxorhynchites rutilus septentrionalis]
MRNLLGFAVIFITLSTGFAATVANVHYLNADGVIAYKPDRSSIYRPGLRTYCYRGKEKQLVSLFQTIILHFDCDHDDFSQYEGGTPEEVRSHHETEQSLFSFNILSNSKKRLIKLDPFNQSCIGVVSGDVYSVRLSVIRIDFWRVIILAAGIFVFLSAAKLSDNALFYYICGVGLGVFASFLVVVYMVSKLVPRKPMMYGVMIGGWTLGLYFAQMMLDNLRVIFVTYQVYVFWYILTTGFISFVICYRMGPPKNQRSKDLIKWSLQMAALGAIFFSSAYREATTGICIAIICFYFFPRSISMRARSFYRNRFPPKRRFLTEEEYYEQGVKETTKALEELREYCRSPQCKQWSTMLKLRDPTRFASFMEGSSHLIDSEILEYETSNPQMEISDDEGEVDDKSGDEEEPQRERNQRGASRTTAYQKFAQQTLRNGVSRASTSTPTVAAVTNQNGRSRSSRSRSRQLVMPSAPPADEFELSEDED